MTGRDSFGAEGTLQVGDRRYHIHRLSALEGVADLGRVPYSIKLLLENLLRHEDGVNVKAEDVEALARREIGGAAREIAYSPARILLQDFTGVPCVVDLAAMRDAIEALGGNAEPDQPPRARRPRDRPLRRRRRLRAPRRPPGEHQPRVRTQPRALPVPALGPAGFLELPRRAARHGHLPPGQPRVPEQCRVRRRRRAPPSRHGRRHRLAHHRWSTASACSAGASAGIEAEAAMLGQPLSMLVPPVVGLRLTGELPEGTTATDLVLTVAELLRSRGVVGKFVECYGPGVAEVPLENRATIGNMSPEYGSTATIFPIDQRDLRYLRLTGRDRGTLQLCGGLRQGTGPVARRDGRARLLRTDRARPLVHRAEPRRPVAPPGPRPAASVQGDVRRGPPRSLPEPVAVAEGPDGPPAPPAHGAWPTGLEFDLEHGHVVIAAITSCTNTSNPQVMIAAGLLAKKAVELGLEFQAVGEDDPRTGLPGRHGLPRAGRAGPVSREARLRPRRLRLHDVHRQLGPAARGSLRGHQRRWPGRARLCCPAIAISRAGSIPTSG